MTEPERWSIELASSLESLEEPWKELAAASGNVFLSFEWQSSWWRHFGRGRPLMIGVARAPGRVAAIFPIYEAASRPVRVLRSIGHGASDELGPVCRPEDRAIAARALGELADELSARFDLLMVDELPQGVEWSSLLGARTLLSQASPLCRFEAPDGAGTADGASRSSGDGGYGAWLETRSAKPGARPAGPADRPSQRFAGCRARPNLGRECGRSRGARCRGRYGPGTSPVPVSSATAGTFRHRRRSHGPSSGCRPAK